MSEWASVEAPQAPPSGVSAQCSRGGKQEALPSEPKHPNSEQWLLALKNHNDNSKPVYGT